MSKNVNPNTKKSSLVLLPVILLIGFVPLIVHTYSYNSNLSQFDWYPANSDQQVDFFFACKMIAIIVIGIVMAGILLYRYWVKKETLKFENCFYLLFGYALFVAMSALFSTHKYWVARGIYELFEPVWVVFIYMILCYYVYNYVNEEKQVYTILRWAGIGMAVVTLIGVFQYFGKDFFRTSFGKHLITSSKWWNQLDQLRFNMAEDTSYTTLYNPNFLSFYFGMLIPLIVCLFIGAKKWWHRIALVVAEVLCVLCLKGSKSDTGWMAIVAATVILVLVLLSRRKKLFIAGIVVLVIGIIASATLGMKTTAGQRIKDTVFGTYHMEERYALRSVETNDDNVTLDIRGNSLVVTYDTMDDGLLVVSCKDDAGNELSRTVTDETNQISTIDDAKYEGIQVQPIVLGENTPAVRLYIAGVTWDFLKDQEGGYYYCNPAGKAVKFPTVKTSRLFKEDAMSYRGRIWNNTIPLLGKHVLVGSGANTYMLEIPQDDYLGMNYIYGANSYDVKAHCWYLQQWVETGLIGTLLLLGFMLWYFVQSVRIYRRVRLHGVFTWTGFGLFAAVLTYLIAGIANDSNVCTAPVFWGILGLGIAVNHILVEKEGLFVKEAVEEETHTQADTAVETAPNKTVSSKKQSRKQRKNKKK